MTKIANVGQILDNYQLELYKITQNTEHCMETRKKLNILQNSRRTFWNSALLVPNSGKFCLKLL